MLCTNCQIYWPIFLISIIWCNFIALCIMHKINRKFNAGLPAPLYTWTPQVKTIRVWILYSHHIRSSLLRMLMLSRFPMRGMSGRGQRRQKNFAYEQTSHPSNMKTWLDPLQDLWRIHLKMTRTRLIWGLGSWFLCQINPLFMFDEKEVRSNVKIPLAPTLPATRHALPTHQEARED